MSKTAERLTSLSPQERRALLARMLRQKAHKPKLATLSFSQLRLWFLTQLEPDTTDFNLPSAARLTGELDVGALQRGLGEVVRRHAVLRTSFVELDGQPRQLIAPTGDLALPLVDLTRTPAALWEEHAQQVAAQACRRPFDLAQSPLMRAVLMRLADREHVLFVCMHHIISDLWSGGVFLRELAALYATYAQGRPSLLPELPLQYADYARWQHDWLQGDVLEAHLNYWREQLANLPPMLELPADRPRPAVRSFEGAVEEFQIDGALVQKLRALGRRESASLYMIMLTALLTLFSRYTGQEDISVGTFVANRTRAELEGLIGFFTNTLVLRTDLRGDPTLRELLQRVREVTLGAYAHQALPFEKLLEALQPARGLSHTPLFQVMLTLQNTPAPDVELPGLTVRSMQARRNIRANFDLTMWLWEVDAGLSGWIEYSVELFDASTIRRMLGHFQRVLEGVAADPDQPLSSVPILTAAERHQLLVGWNDTHISYPEGQHVHQLFEAQAARSPDAVALVYRDQQLTFGELNQRANQLTRHLRTLGVGPESRVAICLERSLELVVAVWATLKAGGAYVSLDPVHPPERQAHILQDARVLVLLTSRSLLPELPKHHQAHVVCLDADEQAVVRQSRTNPVNVSTAQNLAYLVYTSGSTGQPKGVMVTHGGLTNVYLAWETAYRLECGDCHLQMASFSFDVFTGDLVRALCSGAKLVLCPRELLLEPGQLYGLMCREKVNCGEFVPVVVRSLVQYLQTTGHNLSFVRLLIVGSDSWYVQEFRLVRSLCSPGTRLVNSYGLSEATIDSSYFEQVQLDLSADEPVPIGRPFANTQVYLLDRNLEPVPAGVPGEVYVGGAGLARGYLNRPKLTAQTFLPSPFVFPTGGDAVKVGEAGARLYKTGDQARFLPNGDIQYLGRVDHQVKVRGFRVELGEIESVLGAHPAIQETAVVFYENGAGDKRLVAYVVPHPALTLREGALHRFLKSKLPDYMLPSAFVRLESLPLTPSGKVDRRALPAPERLRPELEAAFVAPRTPVEQKIAGIWSQVLEIERVGVDDSFFELGGHSLLATQIISRVRRAFQVELPLRSLFKEPTLAGLAAAVEAGQRLAQGPPLSSIVPAPRDRELPLSFAQQRLWFLDQWAPGSPWYNIPAAVRLSGRLEVIALAQSLNEIVRRHESLRTTFAMTDGRPVQTIASVCTLPLPVIDLSALPDPVQTVQLRRLAAQAARWSFDLGRGPLLRTSLLRLDAETHVLLLNMHHIVSDGWSVGIMIQELAALYQAFSAGEPSPLPDLPIQYADFALWQRQWLQGEVLDKQLAYWKRRLSDAPVALKLPTDRQRPPQQTFRGSSQSFDLSPSLSEALEALARQHEVTLFMTLLAAFKALLYRYTGQADIIVGSPIANRNRAEIEGLIGFFVNTLALRTGLGGEPSFRDLLDRVREVTLEAYAHQDVPFEKLVEELRPARDASRAPLFQVMFVLYDSLMDNVALPGLTLSPLEIDSEVARFDLVLSLVDRASGLRGSFEYNTDLFEAETIRRMIGHFQNLLAGIVTDPEQSIAAVPLLGAAERQQLLVDWNDTWADDGRGQCILELLEAQVARAPAAVALVCDDQHLTYHQLNRRTNQLAHHLVELGVGPEVRVGLCVERSLEMVVGLLGVLKAGGAYVPLDPSYPPARLALMLQDAQTPVLLTQAHLRERVATLAPQDKPFTTVCLDTDWDAFAIARRGGQSPARVVSVDQLAYVVYTSGSTGRPKGVLVTHRGLGNLAQAQARAFEVHSDSRVLQYASLSFDASVSEIVKSLAVGATLCLARRDELLPGPNLVRLLKAQAVTAVTLPPSVLALLTPQALTGLRTVVSAGETCSVDLVERWGVGRRFLNAYGPTEATVCATISTCSGNGHRPPSIGRPMANTQAFILDAHQQPLPVGVPGELCIGGVGLARGYHDQPASTAAKFVPHPFCRVPGARLYRTGDLARHRADGEIEFLGRIDHQVKLRGFRIELGEIEAVLGEHPAVRETVVLACEAETGGPATGLRPGKRLVAYIVPHSGETPTTIALRRFLQHKLPDYMLPTDFVTLEALPLTPNGKVDRRGLPPLQGERLDLGQAFVAPRTPIEQRVASIMGQVLNLDRVGVHDDFFSLGGHSLLATQLVSRLSDEFQVFLPLQTVFEGPTVAELAAWMVATRLEQVKEDALAQVLAQVDELSDEEANVLLFAKGG